MTILDATLLVVLLYGAFKGFRKGLLVELASLAALLLGIYGAIHFSGFIANYLRLNFDWNAKTMSLMAFGITFIAIVFAVYLLGKILTKTAEILALGIFNKILGALFSATKFFLIISIVIYFYDKLNNTFNILSSSYTNQSVVYQLIKDIGTYLVNQIQELLN